MLELIQGFIDAQLHNAVFSGGLALGAFGGMAALTARLPVLLRHLVDAYLSTSVTVDSRSSLFKQMVAWLSQHPYGRHCRRLHGSLIDTDGDDTRQSLSLSPSAGVHYFWERGVPLWVKRSKAERDTGGLFGNSQLPPESITIRALTRDRDFLRTLLADIHHDYDDRRPDQIQLFSTTNYGEWQVRGQIPKRALSSIILPDNVADLLLGDARAFLAAEHWYADRGIPWRRGYLLHGPPGTGKTSLVKALAGVLDLDLCTINLASERIDDDVLAELMASAPRRGLLLFEDIDALFAGREQLAAGPKLTFSGLLNAIDGVAAQEGRLLVMTTNHPERLDPALIRPGRIDRRVELGLADAALAARMVRTFFPERPDLAVAAAHHLGAGHIAPAALQGCLLACRDEPNRLEAELAAIPTAPSPSITVSPEGKT